MTHDEVEQRLQEAAMLELPKNHHFQTFLRWVDKWEQAAVDDITGIIYQNHAELAHAAGVVHVLREIRKNFAKKLDNSELSSSTQRTEGANGSGSTSG